MLNRVKGCGFVKLLAEVGLGGEGSIKKALKGGDVKEGVRLYKLLFEAILRSKIKYLMRNHTTPLYKKLASLINSEELNHENVQKIIDDPQFHILPELNGSLSCWLDSFLEMVDLLLCTIHCQRSGDRNGYLRVFACIFSVLLRFESAELFAKSELLSRKNDESEK